MRLPGFTQLLKSLQKNAAAGILLASVYVFTLAQPVFAQTKTWSGVCVSQKDLDVATIQGIQCLLGNVFTVIITVIGLAAFVMFIVAAFRYMTSSGNTKGTEGARNTMTFAVVGIVVALSGFIVLNLLASFTGVEDITTISIPTTVEEAP